MTEIYGYCLGKMPFELGVEKYVAIRHLGFQVSETDEQMHRSYVIKKYMVEYSEQFILKGSRRWK